MPGAEAAKLQLEQSQRERRIEKERRGEVYKPKWFVRRPASSSSSPAGDSGHSNNDDGDRWEFTGAYWEARAQNKFVDMDLERLW